MSAVRRIEGPSGLVSVDPEFDRALPLDFAAEQCALGGMLLNSEAVAVVSGIVVENDFYEPKHGLIFATILGMYGRGEHVDPLTVAHKLTKEGEVTRAGGLDYLITLIQVVPVVANVGYYAKLVRESATRRRLIEAGTRVVQLGHMEAGDVDEAVSRAQTVVHEVAQDNGLQDLLLVGDSLEGALNEIELTGSGNGAHLGVPTGLRDLDGLVHGLTPGQLVVVAARPGLGKSTLGLDFCRSASIKNGLASAIFSLEMSRSEIVMRLLSAEAQVPLHYMRSGRMRDDDWERIAERLDRVAEAPLYIDDSPYLTLAEIRAKAQRLKQRHDLRLVVVDYLQLMSSARRVESRQQEVADLSRSLKLLAKELEVPVVAISQLNRGSEQRQDKKPQLSDLRESGAIEQDADLVILLYREDAFEKESPRAGEADLIVAKHRNGPTATVTVAFQGHYSRFVDMANLDWSTAARGGAA